MRRVDVVRLGSATVRASVPVGSTGTYGLWSNGRSPGSRTGELAEDGRIELTHVAPGPYHFSVEFERIDRSRTNRAFGFELADGEVRDLGMLGEEPDTVSLTIVPSLEIDGVLVEDSGSAEYDGMHWHVELYDDSVTGLPSGASAGGHYEFDGFHPATIRGLPKGVCRLDLDGFTSEVDRLNELHFLGWDIERVVDLEVDTTVSGTMRFASAPRLALSATVPATPGAHGLEVTWSSWNPVSGTPEHFSTGSTPQRANDDAPWQLSCEKTHDPGTRTFFVFAHGDGEFDPGAAATNASNASFYGAREITLMGSGPREVEIEMELAANAILPAGYFGPPTPSSAPRCFSVEGRPDNYGHLWRAERLDDGRLLYRSLPPFTEFTVRSNGNTTTGGPGSIVVVGE
ncbi:MAG: hypothetical protein R3F34_04065 [Planctomycetota bacterium]